MCLGGFCCVLVSQHVTKVDRFKEITGYFCLQVTEEEKTGAEEAAVKEKEVRGVHVTYGLGLSSFKYVWGASVTFLSPNMSQKLTVSKKSPVISVYRSLKRKKREQKKPR